MEEPTPRIFKILAVGVAAIIGSLSLLLLSSSNDSKNPGQSVESNSSAVVEKDQLAIQSEPNHSKAKVEITEKELQDKELENSQSFKTNRQDLDTSIPKETTSNLSADAGNSAASEELPPISAQEVEKILFAYGLEYKKTKEYRKTAKFLSSSSKEDRNSWLDQIVKRSQELHPVLATRISRTSTLNDAMLPWVEVFAQHAKIPVELVDWRKSYSLVKISKAKNEPTVTKFIEWMYEKDAYFLNYTPGGVEEIEREEQEARELAMALLRGFGYL